jgi:hypothetical protein
LRISGFEEKFPRAVVFGPTIFGGLGFRQLYVDSNCIKIETIICNINGTTSLGESIKININWIQLIVGSETPILESRDQIPHIERNWITAIRDFLIETNSTIKIKNLWKPSISREHDQILMDQVMTLDIPNTHKIIFNNYRIYFKVLTTSDLTNNEGTHIRPEFLNKTTAAGYKSTTKLKWPNQKMPSIKYFNIWTKILQEITNCSESGRLTNPLGSWLSHQLIAVHDMKINMWKHYLRSHTVRSSIYFNTNQPVEFPDMNMAEYEPIDVELQGTFYKTNLRR